MSIKIMQKKQFIILSILSILISSAFLPNIGKSKELAKFNDWSAFSEGEGKNLACMAVSKPKKSEGIILKEVMYLQLLPIFQVKKME